MLDADDNDDDDLYLSSSLSLSPSDIKAIKRQGERSRDLLYRFLFVRRAEDDYDNAFFLNNRVERCAALSIIL